MMITAWGDTKELLEFLDDFRVHPSVTRDSVVKRLKRHEIPELALTKPVCGEAKSGDTNLRIKARKEKTAYRVKMFLLAQEVRRKSDMGVEHSEIQKRYQISKSQCEKIISKNEWYNAHWQNMNVPEEYKEITDEIKKKGLLSE